MREAGNRIRVPGATGYDLVRIVLGVVLLTAAALKGHQLATEPVAATGLLDSRWFLIGVVEFELFFGLWLWFGLYPRQTRRLALACFSTFGCVALYKALSGETSCGCFGRVPVNPWYTLGLDLAAVAALLRWRPAPGPAAAPCPGGGERAGVRARTSPRPLAGEGPGVRAGPRRQFACVLGISLLLGLPAALSMASYQAATLDEAGDVFGDSEFVVLEPETWVGKRFALLKHIDIGDRLAEGDWIVVLYHRDCPECLEEIPKYEQLARHSASDPTAPRVALIEVPPYGDLKASRRSFRAPCVLGRLSDERDWFVETPVELLLEGALVSCVKRNGEVISQEKVQVSFGRVQ